MSERDEIGRPETLGELLGLLMHRAGLTRDQLARAAGMGTGTASRYLKDQVRRPDARALRRLSDVLAERLEVDPAQLWGEVGSLVDRQHRLAWVEAKAQIRRR